MNITSKQFARLTGNLEPAKRKSVRMIRQKMLEPVNAHQIIDPGMVTDGRYIIEMRLPLALRGGLNSRQSHWVDRRFAKTCTNWVTVLMTTFGNTGGRLPELPLRVTMIRHGPRLLDKDNLGGVCKPLRDAIASYFGADDADHKGRWEWRPEQSIDKCYGVTVRIEEIGRKS